MAALQGLSRDPQDRLAFVPVLLRPQLDHVNVRAQAPMVVPGDDCGRGTHRPQELPMGQPSGGLVLEVEWYEGLVLVGDVDTKPFEFGATSGRLFIVVTTRAGWDNSQSAGRAISASWQPSALMPVRQSRPGARRGQHASSSRLGTWMPPVERIVGRAFRFQGRLSATGP
jgi:hypothetical protein